ncbi:MAG: shikimate kinase [Synergistaceae bacterium]
MKKFGLLGEKLGHSFSPLIHSMLGDYAYDLCEISPENLSDFLAHNDYDGFNVTIPYKKMVLSHCDELSEKAKQVGSVNTLIKKQNGSYYGDNTDHDGFSLMISSIKDNVAGKKAVILGSGGVSSTVKSVLKDLGAKEIITVSRTGTENYNNLYLHSDAQIIVNTTPVGVYPNNGDSPINLEFFPYRVFVADLIYNPARTALILQAEKLDIPHASGLLMLVEQARASSELFTEKKIPLERSIEIANMIAKETQNIVLIGMPGSGKSSVGKLLSELTGRPFVDIDGEIVKKLGRVIPKILMERGEEYFRKKESEVLSEFCKESGLIIATGGGVVVTPENKEIMRQNSLVVYIKRDLKELATIGRPISIANGVEELYEMRAPFYESWQDISVENSDPHLAAQKIVEELNL